MRRNEVCKKCETICFQTDDENKAEFEWTCVTCGTCNTRKVKRKVLEQTDYIVNRLLNPKTVRGVNL